MLGVLVIESTRERRTIVKTPTVIMLALAAGLLAMACAVTSSPMSRDDSEADNLVGAWRGKVQFKTGAFAEVKDLEFLYVFNAGGTMTESSNYDGAPPVPPAYGVWRKTWPRQYEVKYIFYPTKAPATFDDIAKGGGWLPAGRVVLVETITLAADGKTFRSTIRYDAFDKDGKPTETGSTAESVATRMGF
jgi:hypothetical protein